MRISVNHMKALDVLQKVEYTCICYLYIRYRKKTNTTTHRDTHTQPNQNLSNNATKMRPNIVVRFLKVVHSLYTQIYKIYNYILIYTLKKNIHTYLQQNPS